MKNITKYFFPMRHEIENENKKNLKISKIVLIKSVLKIDK